MIRVIALVVKQQEELALLKKELKSVQDDLSYLRGYLHASNFKKNDL